MPDDEPSNPRVIPMPAETNRMGIDDYTSNYISTTKYTLLTFLPKGLFY